MFDRRKSFIASVGACSIMALLPTAALDAAPPPSFQGLGDLPGGGFWSTPNGISADGAVVVGQSRSASGSEAFRWTSSGGMVGLSWLDGSNTSVAFATSANGSVVVGASITILGGSADSQAFHWTADGGMVDLGGLPGGSFNSSIAYATSADGAVVVGQSRSASGSEAFRWTSSGGMVGLGDLPGGIFSSSAFATSADGAVVVGRAWSASGLEAFRWTASGGMIGLGDLPGGAFSSTAFAASADGSVVVGEGISAPGFEAFRWTASGGMVGLGDLPGGGFSSQACGTSADGEVVVGASRTNDGLVPFEAFLWTANNGMRLLQDVLSIDLGLDLTGWTLLDATGISADGTTIVGIGTNPNGFREAWLAFLPKPVTLVPLDIKPGSCPNSFNRNSNGVLPVALLGSDAFDVSQIDLASVTISRADGVGGSAVPNEGPPGPHSALEDVGTPFDGELCDCHQLTGDGFIDLSMKFRITEVVAALELDALPPGDLVELTVSGNLLDGTPFSASDCVRLVPPGTAPGELLVDSGAVDRWIDADPLDIQLDGGGFDAFERTYPLSTAVTITAPPSITAEVFFHWVIDGVRQPNGLRTITLLITQEQHQADAIYRLPSVGDLRPRRYGTGIQP